LTAITQGNPAQNHDGLQILFGLVRQTRIRRICRVNADRAEQKVGTVGRCLGHQAGAQVAAHPGFVVHDEGLPIFGGESLRNDASEHVRSPTGNERCRDLDGAGWNVFRCKQLRRDEHRAERKDGCAHGASGEGHDVSRRLMEAV